MTGYALQAVSLPITNRIFRSMVNHPPRRFDKPGMKRFDLICLGCGPAGEKAATQASYYRKRVAIVEKHSRPGGAMVNTGTLPSKTLRETALLCSAFKRRPLPGMDFAIDHKLSLAKFMARRHLMEQQEHDRIESSVDRHGIEVFRGIGKITDPNTIVITGVDGITTKIHADNILITTGSSPLRPDHIPFDHPGVVDADGVLELESIPKSMIIVGAGVIGCEYASVFAEIDVEVTLINPHCEVLTFLDVECRDHLLIAMQKSEVKFKLGDSVKSVVPQDDGLIRVELEKGSLLEAETLLWAAGRTSNTHNLGLEEVGVELGNRGLVIVDENYRTNIESIYAAGDVIGFPALASTSMEQGRIAACRMFNNPFKQNLTENMPIGLYTIPAVSSVGLTEESAKEAGHTVVVGRALYQFNARGRMLGDSQGILKCVFDRETRKLLGTTIVGENATELVHIAQAVIANDGGIDYFIDTCFNYPSLAEMYKYAAYSALQTLARLEDRDDELGDLAKVA